MHNGCNGCMPVAYCAPAFDLAAISQNCTLTCVLGNAISITLQPISSTCKKR